MLSQSTSVHVCLSDFISLSIALVFDK